MFLCEHWLSPAEISTPMSDILSPHWHNLKSSIDPNVVLRGRPYGGCGFVCKKVPGIVYKPITCLSDRISGIELINNGKTILTIFGVYLPCDDHRLGSHETYIDTLNEVQGYIDNCSTPFMVVGDFNTRLPQSTSLSQRWFRSRPCAKRSALLYNFITDKDSYVVNFDYTQPLQPVPFTFHCGDCKSYIDHMIASTCLHPNIEHCSIT